MEVLMYLVLALFGLCIGSFAGATIWRLRARQLVDDKKAGEKVSAKELKSLRPLTKSSLRDDRSRCLHCAHTLAWYDLVPLFSWLSTGGRCRYCRAPIGWFEPTIELSMAAIFVLLAVFWPSLIAGPLSAWSFGLWLVASALLVMLFFYDLKWQILPNKIVFPLIAVAVIIRALLLVGDTTIAAAAISLLSAIMILSGVYLALYYYSSRRYGPDKTWVGFGDVKLGLALALLLGTWQLALLCLFIGNLIGVLVVLPGLIRKDIGMSSRVALGPLLILGFFVALFVGPALIDWYLSVSLLGLGL